MSGDSEGMMMARGGTSGASSGRRMRRLLVAVALGLLACAAVLPPPAAALDVGLQSTGDGASKQACSRTCESDHCTTPPLLRYGKYCGILYSGCPGEPPCDALDACCMHHDYCVQAKNDYLSTACNEGLLDCLARLRQGTSTFEGNKCMIDEVIDVISLVIEAAVVAGRVLHKP